MRRLRDRLWIRAVASAFGLVVAIAGTAVPTYLWCAGAREVQLTCCCPHLEDDAGVLKAPCCEARANVSTDGAQSSDGAPRVGLAAPAVMVALLPRHDLAPDTSRALDREALARDGPPDRLHARCSIYLL